MKSFLKSVNIISWSINQAAILIFRRKFCRAQRTEKFHWWDISYKCGTMFYISFLCLFFLLVMVFFHVELLWKEEQEVLPIESRLSRRDNCSVIFSAHQHLSVLINVFSFCQNLSTFLRISAYKQHSVGIYRLLWYLVGVCLFTLNWWPISTRPLKNNKNTKI